jgi:hypothetical protein
LGDTAVTIEKTRPKNVDQNKVGARPMKEVMGTQIMPPTALESDDLLACIPSKTFGGTCTYIIKTLMLLVWLMVPTDLCHSTACKMIGALPDADAKSAVRAAQATVKRIRCFFREDQFNGSSISSVG